MNLLLLAGNSLNNKNWIEQVRDTLAPHFSKTHIHYYKHWSTEDDLMDLEYELSELTKTVGNLEAWIVFAKSAGTLIVLKGVHEKRILPEKCIFAGTAIGWGRAKGFDLETWLRGYSIPTLFIQKTSDPAISYKDLASLLLEIGVSNSVTLEIPGNDHSYEDMGLLEREVLRFSV